MEFELKINTLIKFLLLIVFLPKIHSDCSIGYPSDINIIPRYKKFIGKHILQIPYNGNSIKLYNGETVEGFCDTYFSPITYETKDHYYNDYRGRYQTQPVTKSTLNQTSITLNCRDSGLFYNGKALSISQFACELQRWGIYSTKNPYSWCTSNQNSSTFLFAAKPTTNTLGAICYNMNQISLQTVVLNTTHLRQNHVDQPNATTETMVNNDLDEHLWNFKTTTFSDLSEELLKVQLMELAKTDEWLDLANYEISLIVQEDTIKKYLEEYKNVLNVIWWRNLRLGNWKRFMNTLANHSHNNNYELYLGTSGVAEYPSEDKCNQEKLLEMKFGFENETVPAYIWTYLRSYDNLNKEFIIVGYNSPYAEYFGLEKVIFCPDICSDIPWLNKISAAFRYTVGGIMFCCSTDFIRQTNYLQGFPKEVLLASNIETTVRTTTEQDSLNLNWITNP